MPTKSAYHTTKKKTKKQREIYEDENDEGLSNGVSRGFRYRRVWCYDGFLFFVKEDVGVGFVLFCFVSCREGYVWELGWGEGELDGMMWCIDGEGREGNRVLLK